MRGSAKNISLLAGLAALLIPVVANAAAVSCESAQNVKREFSEGEIGRNCGTPGSHQGSCRQAYLGMNRMSKQYIDRVQTVCGNINENTKKIDTNGQKDALESQKTMLDSSKTSVNELVTMADGFLSQDLPQQSKPLAAQYNSLSDGNAQTKKMAELFMDKNYEDKFRTSAFDENKALQRSNPSGVSRDLHGAMWESSKFIRALITDKTNRMNTARMLQSHSDDVSRAIARLDQVPSPSASPAAASKGPLDMATMAALAGPAAGLAQAMMQKKNQSGVSDSAATPTTPETTAEKPAGAASGKLGNAATSKTGPVTDDPKTGVAATDTAFAEAVGEDFGSALEDAFSGISNASTAGGSAAGGGSSSGASSGGSAGGGSGGESLESEKSRTPASTTAATEDALQSFGGGGGLNFAGGGADASSPGTPPADESMKEMLSDMESAIDGDGGLSGFGEMQGDSGIAPQDSESLFPRVSAAHVRSLKRGELLNGVGESVVDE